MNAISRLGIVPIRSNPSDSSEMVSQLIYGERCCILEKQGSWSHIETVFDGYRGWVDSLQVSALSADYTPDHVLVEPVIGMSGQYLPMGSELSISAIPDELLSGTDLKAIGEKWTAAHIADHAEVFLKAPYLWGGRTIFGVDCSGLTQVLYKVGGHTLPRDSGDQEKCGKTMSLDDCTSGDLAFFSKPRLDKVSHVGLVVKEKNAVRIIHASSWVKKDLLTSDGIIDDTGKLTHRLISVKRIISEGSGSE